jgi:hypothetical protein
MIYLKLYIRRPMETCPYGSMAEMEIGPRKTHVMAQHHHLAMFVHDTCLNIKLTSPTTIVKLITTIYFVSLVLLDSSAR